MAVKKKAPTFEDDLERLEEIAEKMEEGDVSLEKLCEMYDEGMKLSASLKKRLEAVSCKLQIVRETSEGVSVTGSGLADGEIPREDNAEEEDEHGELL